MPSHVEASLMRTRDLSIPMDLYNYEVYQYKVYDLEAYFAYINDVQSFVDGSLNVEGETSIDLCGDLARYYLQNFLTKFYKETVQCGVDLLFRGATLRIQSIPLLVSSWWSSGAQVLTWSLP